jgi:sec-independent protein translocase protein TatC
MILTPPDIFSQTLLAVPMWLLFEIGVLCSSMITKRGDHEDDEKAEDEQSQPPATQP